MEKTFVDEKFFDHTVDFDRKKVYWRVTTLHEYYICPYSFYKRRVENNVSKKIENLHTNTLIESGNVFHNLFKISLQLIHNGNLDLKTVSEKFVDTILERNMYTDTMRKLKKNMKVTLVKALDYVLENFQVTECDTKTIFSAHNYFLKLVPDVITENNIIELKTISQEESKSREKLSWKTNLQLSLYKEYFNRDPVVLICDIYNSDVYVRTEYDRILNLKEKVRDLTRDVLDEKFDKTDNVDICLHCNVYDCDRNPRRKKKEEQV